MNSPALRAPGSGRAPRATRPCPACAAPVDPLRAPRVAWRFEAFRYFCSAECLERDTAKPGPAAPSYRPLVEASAPPARVEATAEVPTETVRSSALDVGAFTAEPCADEPDAELGASSAFETPEITPLVSLTPQAPEQIDEAPAAPRELSVPIVPLDAEPATGLPFDLAAVCLAAVVAQAVAQGAPLGPGAAAAAVLPFALVAAALSLRATLALRAQRVARTLAWWAPVAGALAYLVHAARSGAPAARSLADFALLCVAPALGARLARGMLVGLRETHGELERALASAAAGAHRTLRAGEEFALEAGDAVPADAAVREGEGTAGKFPGAVRASRFAPGDTLLAGARIERGTLRALAVRVGSATTLARALRASARDEAPASTVRWADRAALAFPVACALASGAATHAQGALDGFAFLGPAGAALLAAPAALAAVLARVPWRAASLRGAREGVLYRDGASVESAARVRAVLFCARGTVTAGTPELVECVSLGRMTERELISLAASAEECAVGHPLADAVRAAARARGLRADPLRRALFTPSRGVSGVTAQGAPVRVGSRDLLLAEGVSVARAEEAASAIEAQRRTAAFVSVDDRVEAVLGFEDPLRTEARAVVQALADMSLDLSLLGGGSRGTLEAIGRALDVADVRPEVAPEDRASLVRSVGDVSERVAVVGRPARDGAALGAATVSIALGPPRAGAEPSLVLAEEDLRGVPRALARARVARRRAWASALICALGGLACVLVATVPRGAAWLVTLLGCITALAATWAARRG